MFLVVSGLVFVVFAPTKCNCFWRFIYFCSKFSKLPLASCISLCDSSGVSMTFIFVEARRGGHGRGK